MATKKPGLSLVEPPAAKPSAPSANLPAPPATLGEPGAALWRATMAEYQIADGGVRQMLLQICSAADSSGSVRRRNRRRRANGRREAGSFA